MAVLITNIGELVTNDPEREGPLGLVTDAALVVDGATVAWVGAAADAPAADERSTPAAAPCCPGSSTATATWSSPATARRSSRPGWPASRTPPAASAPPSPPPGRPPTSSSPRTSPGHVAEMRRQGTTTVEIKSGYGLTVRDEARSLAVARQFTDETTFLGAHVVPAEYADDPAGYVDLVTGPMLEAAAPHARWVDVFCETRRLRRRPGARRARRRRRRRPARPAARQPARPGPGRPAGCRARAGRRRPLHLPRRRRRRRAPRLGHHRDAAARRRVLDPAALPRRATAARRRRPGRAGQRLQPRLVLHELGAALHRARGAGDGADAGRGRPRRDVRRRAGAAPRRRRGPGSRASAPTSRCWTPRATSTWPTGPACRWSRRPGSAVAPSKAPGRYLRRR